LLGVQNVPFPRLLACPFFRYNESWSMAMEALLIIGMINDFVKKGGALECKGFTCGAKVV